MTQLEECRKAIEQICIDRNECWYDTKILANAVYLILDEIMADRKTENSSEKPNNCEDEQQTEYRIGYYTPTNAEILKALEDEPRTCFNCKHNVTKHTFDHACGGCIKMDRYEREDKQSGKE